MWARARLVPRPHPDLWDKIWEWPGYEARRARGVYTLRIRKVNSHAEG